MLGGFQIDHQLEAIGPFEFIEFADVQDAIDDVEDIFALMNAVPDARVAPQAYANLASSLF